MRSYQNRTLAILSLIYIYFFQISSISATQEEKRIAFTIKATVNQAHGQFKPSTPIFRVEYTGEIPILIRVERIVHGNSPWIVGQEITILIHSPALMFGNYDFDGNSYLFTFKPEEEDGWLLDSCVTPEYEGEWPLPVNRDEYGCRANK